MQSSFDAYRHHDNFERPHQALGDAVPASRYPPSARAWRAPESDFDYAPAAILRRVKSHGEITFQNRSFYIGAAFRTQPSALLPTAQDGLYQVRFHACAIGQVDLRVPNSKPKGNYYPMDKITPML